MTSKQQPEADIFPLCICLEYESHLEWRVYARFEKFGKTIFVSIYSRAVN